MSPGRDYTWGPDGRPRAFHDVPESAFPITFKVYSGSGVLLWTDTLHGPGVLEVPGFGYGNARLTVVEYGDGTIVKQPFDSDSEAQETSRYLIEEGERRRRQ